MPSSRWRSSTRRRTGSPGLLRPRAHDGRRRRGWSQSFKRRPDRRVARDLRRASDDVRRANERQAFEQVVVIARRALAGDPSELSRRSARRRDRDDRARRARSATRRREEITRVVAPVVEQPQRTREQQLLRRVDCSQRALRPLSARPHSRSPLTALPTRCSAQPHSNSRRRRPAKAPSASSWPPEMVKLRRQTDRRFRGPAEVTDLPDLVQQCPLVGPGRDGVVAIVLALADGLVLHGALDPAES